MGRKLFQSRERKLKGERVRLRELHSKQQAPKEPRFKSQSLQISSFVSVFIIVSLFYWFHQMPKKSGSIAILRNVDLQRFVPWSIWVKGGNRKFSLFYRTLFPPFLRIEKKEGWRKEVWALDFILLSVLQNDKQVTEQLYNFISSCEKEANVREKSNQKRTQHWWERRNIRTDAQHENQKCKYGNCHGNCLCVCVFFFLIILSVGLLQVESFAEIVIGQIFVRPRV